jgi:hypothetical protein
MPELSRTRVLVRTRRAGLLGWLWLAALPAFASPESLPASVRSCAHETDPGRRLACYDRETARFPEAAPAPQAAAPRDSSSAVAATPAGKDRASPAEEQKPTRQESPAKEPGHLLARVVRIEQSPNEMVLHLDNGQVWQQAQAVSGDMGLRAGDAVKINKQLGSYWLSGPHGLTMKVRQKASQPEH